MKKAIFIFAILSTIIFTGCYQEDVAPEEPIDFKLQQEK